MKQIVNIMLSQVARRLKEAQIGLDVTDAAKSAILAKGLDPAYGARPLRRAIQHMVEDAVTDMVLRNDVGVGDVVFVDVDPEKELVLTRRE